MSEIVSFCTDMSYEKIASDIFHKWHVDYDASASSGHNSIRFYIDIEEGNALKALNEAFNAIGKECKDMDRLELWLEPVE